MPGARLNVRMSQLLTRGKQSVRGVNLASELRATSAMAILRRRLYCAASRAARVCAGDSDEERTNFKFDLYSVLTLYSESHRTVLSRHAVKTTRQADRRSYFIHSLR